MKTMSSRPTAAPAPTAKDAPPLRGASSLEQQCVAACSTTPALASACVLLRHEVERRAGRNQLFLLHAVLELAHDAVGVLHDPPAHVTLVDRLALLRILLQVGDARKAERQLGIMEVLLALEVDLEVLPLHSMQFVLEPDHAGLAAGLLMLAKEEPGLILAVDQPVLRRLATDELEQRGEHVGDMHHLVAFDPCRDVSRPSDQERRADAAFGRGEVGAVEEAAGAAAGEMIFGAIVAAHHD